jgi:3-hydroxyisobutyrate dehydrogenase-like beta-hydroxyacid dehydrogenase
MRLAFIGFGEVGQRFSRDLQDKPAIRISAYDIKLDTPETAELLRSTAASLNVQMAGKAAEAIEGADIVISAVTAMAAEFVAKAAVAHMTPEQVFFDINSISPALKSRLSAAFLAADRHYVEGAVMAAVAEPGIAVHILSGGAKAVEVAERLNPLGFNITPVTSEVGRAAATKLCRSIMIKGLEALIIEAEAAATHWGVRDDVFASLAETFPSINWPKLAAVMSSRVRRHGVRRAGEMRECAEMQQDLGRPGDLARAIADVHERHATSGI